MNEALSQERLKTDELLSSNRDLSTTLRRKEEELSQSQQARIHLETEVDTLRRELTVKRDESWKISHEEVILTKQELGRGGWGVILWIGEFRGQTVAVKQMHEMIVGPYTLELLNREINIMAQLRHPNLLQFIGAVFDHPSGNPMIITEVMDTSLRKAYEDKATDS